MSDKAVPDTTEHVASGIYNLVGYRRDVALDAIDADRKALADNGYVITSQVELDELRAYKAAWEPLPADFKAIATAVATCVVPDGYRLTLDYEYDDEDGSTQPVLAVWREHFEWMWKIYYKDGLWGPVPIAFRTAQEAVDSYVHASRPTLRREGDTDA